MSCVSLFGFIDIAGLLPVYIFAEDAVKMIKNDETNDGQDRGSNVSLVEIV